MKQKSRLQEAFYTVGFIVLVTCLCVSGVAIAYQMTKAKIRTNQELRLKRAVIAAAGLEIPTESRKLEKFFNTYITPIKNDKGKTIYYQVKDKGYVAPFQGIGLWGSIHAMIGFNRKLDQLTGIFFTDQNETPGLGGRIDEEWFRKQFKDKKGPLTMVPEGEPTDSHQFDAITGATITSTGVKNMINQAFETSPAIIRKGIDSGQGKD